MSADKLIIWHDNIASPAPLEGAGKNIDYDKNKYRLIGFNYSLNFNNASYEIDDSDDDKVKKEINNSYNLSLDKRSEIYPYDLLNRVFIPVRQNVSTNLPNNSDNRVEVNDGKNTRYALEITAEIYINGGYRLTHTFIIPAGSIDNILYQGQYYSYVFAYPYNGGTTPPAEKGEGTARGSAFILVRLRDFSGATAEVYVDNLIVKDYHVDYDNHIDYPEFNYSYNILHIREVK